MSEGYKDDLHEALMQLLFWIFVLIAIFAIWG